MVDGNTGQAVPKPTKFWLAYDAQYVYFAARVTEPNRRDIQMAEFRTNVGLGGDDYVELDIDPTGSLGEVNAFQINPRGATNVSLAGGRASKREWTGEILAKGSLTDDGWEVEARIPWQIMKLPGAGKHSLRFNVQRRLAKSDRNLVFAFTGNGKSANAPYWVDVELPKPVIDRSIKLLPYGYTGYDERSGIAANAGLDLKTSLTEQIQAVGSINPDFRNVENQILSLDFSRFERLAGETRPFFQEGSDYVESQIFRSQRIDTFDTGLNLYGRLNSNTNFGLLQTLDLDRPGPGGRGTQSNFVGAVTQQPDPNTSIRASFASREDQGVSNQAILLRASRDYGPFNVFVRNMTSSDSQKGIGQRYDLNVNYNYQGFGTFAGVSTSQKSLVTRLGFLPETDFKVFEVGTYFDRSFTHGPFNDYGYFMNFATLDRLNGEYYRKEASASFSGTLRSGIGASFGISDGNFLGVSDHTTNVSMSYPRTNPYRNIGVSYDWGKQAGLDYRTTSLAVAYRIANRLQFTGSYQAQQFGRYVDQAIVGWNYDYDASRTLTGRLVKQRDKVNAYFSLRKSGNRGTEYYLIVGDPNALTFRTSVILKVVVPFQI